MKLALAITCLLLPIDGDSLSCGAERIRLVGFDTPETFRAKCASERHLGDRATARLSELLKRPDVRLVRLRTPDGKIERDKYGRTLAKLYIGGEDVGDILIREGLARSLKWDQGERRKPWC